MLVPAGAWFREPVGETEAGMDALNARYGLNTVSVFSSSALKPWAMRREMMSPCYTTRWGDVSVAHAR